MCGRYTLTAEYFRIQVHFHVDREAPFDWRPRYNIAPTQLAPVILQDDGNRVVRLLRWGLVPSWAKELSIGNRMINARSETAAEKPSFRSAVKARRCLVAADGFYEWRKVGSTKVPMWIHRPDRSVFGFAGLWETWKPPTGGEPVQTFTLLTREASEALRSVHDRMPVVVPGDLEDGWLAPGPLAAGVFDGLVRRAEAEPFVFHSVSPQVNSPRFDDAACVVEAQQDSQSRKS